MPQGRPGGAQGQQVGCIGAAVNHATPGTDDVHDLRSTAKTGHGVAVAHGLRVSGEVCMNPVQLLRPTEGHPEARLDLVDQHELVGRFAIGIKCKSELELRIGEDHPMFECIRPTELIDLE